MSEESKTSKAQQKAVNKYVKNNYDRINVTFPKGEKAIIQAHVSNTGESVNAFINRAVNETMERDSPVLSPTAASLVINQQPAQEQHVQPPTAAQNEPDQQSIPDQQAEHSTAASECTKHGPRKPFTKEAAAQIDTEKLLNDFRYQLDIGLAYGNDVLARLLIEARQQSND